MLGSRTFAHLAGTSLSRRGALRAILTTAGAAAATAVVEVARPSPASAQDICAEGSEVTEITYIGRREDGRHLVRARWRLRAFPEELMRCNDSTRLHATFTARYVGGELRSTTLDLSRDPSRESVVAVLPAVGAADLVTVRVEIRQVAAFRRIARRVERV